MNMNMKIVDLPPKVRRINEESIVNVSQQFLGFDKTIIMLLVVVGLCLAVSYFLFKEVKKSKDEIRNIKQSQIDSDDIAEKVENNNNSVKAMEIKIDQIIGALQSQQMKHQVQSPHQQSDKKQTEHVHKTIQKVIRKIEEDDDDSDGFEDSEDEKVIPTIGGVLKSPVEIRI